jgi:hypothetical protein
MYTIAISLLLYTCLLPNNFRLIIHIHILWPTSWDLNAVNAKLDKLLHIYNFALSVLLPDDVSFIGKPEYAA